MIIVLLGNAFVAPAVAIGRTSTVTDARALVQQHGSPLLVLDCERVRLQYRRLAQALPGVALHYAMKALPHPAVIATLEEEGSYFDVSSSGEIDVIRRLHIAPERLIHTHPIKRDRDIRDALDFGCRTFVVDNADEISKFGKYKKVATLILRVGFPTIDAAVDLAKKFGCAPEDALSLLAVGKRLDLSITGLSFHVGSQCRTARAHVSAITHCAALIAQAREGRVANINLVDLGGGFPAQYAAEETQATQATQAMGDIQEFCAPIREALMQLPPNTRVIAEPGRFIAAPAMTAITTVVGKARRGKVLWYYLDDGVFGSFNGKVFDQGARYPLTTVSDNDAAAVDCRSVLAGPTCDSIDILESDLLLPELRIGDLIVADMMGAYTTVCASEFNSIPRTGVLVLNGPAAAPAKAPISSPARRLDVSSAAGLELIADS